MRVDYYSATIDDADGGEVLAWALEAMPRPCDVGDEITARYGYSHAVPLLEGKQVVCIVRFGGNADTVNLELKGAVSNEVYGLVRSHFPGHACTRMDVAVDGTRPGLFDQMARRMLAIRDEIPANRQPQVNHQGDWHTPAGRSLYIGSRKSDCHVVLYEKGYERQARAGEIAPDLDWCRLEVRIKPERREHKLMLAAMLPLQAWGWTKWASAYLDEFTGLEPCPVVLPRRQHDDDRAYEALLSQYGPILERRAASRHGGSWEGMGESLKRDYDAFRRRRGGLAA